MNAEVFALGAEMVAGAVATFLAILLWSRTRDVAWMLIVTGTVVYYSTLVFEALAILGTVDLDAVMIGTVSVGRTVIAVAPMTFFAIAFAVMLARKIP